MLKKDILDLIDSFERETWKYTYNDNLNDNPQYVLKNIQNDELSIFHLMMLNIKTSLYTRTSLFTKMERL